jgi:hypothetical protein
MTDENDLFSGCVLRAPQSGGWSNVRWLDETTTHEISTLSRTVRIPTSMSV